MHLRSSSLLKQSERDCCPGAEQKMGSHRKHHSTVLSLDFTSEDPYDRTSAEAFVYITDELLLLVEDKIHAPIVFSAGNLIILELF
jgi:hypothetical protein